MTAISDISKSAKQVFQQKALFPWQSLKPVMALAVPLFKRVSERLNWQLLAVGAVAGAAGYALRAMQEPAGGSQPGGKPVSHERKPPELNRWESEGGMIPTTASPAMERPTDRHGDVGTGVGEPPINS